MSKIEESDRLGFTGTQDGMTDAQRQMVYDEVMMLAPTEAHHGLCCGADADFHDLLAHSYVRSIHGHPPTKTDKMARRECDVMHEPKPYLERNRDIVDQTGWLIAAPKGPEEQRSGTWSTVRYARRLKRPISIVWPSGLVTHENVPARLQVRPSPAKDPAQ